MKTYLTRLGWTLSLLFSLCFLISFFWTYTLEGDLKAWQLAMLRVTYLKFAGLDAVSFIAGLVQSFLWGWITAAVFLWLWDRFAKPTSTPQ